MIQLAYYLMIISMMGMMLLPLNPHRLSDKCWALTLLIHCRYTALTRHLAGLDTVFYASQNKLTEIQSQTHFTLPKRFKVSTSGKKIGVNASLKTTFSSTLYMRSPLYLHRISLPPVHGFFRFKE